MAHNGTQCVAFDDQWHADVGTNLRRPRYQWRVSEQLMMRGICDLQAGLARHDLMAKGIGERCLPGIEPLHGQTPDAIAVHQVDGGDGALQGAGYEALDGLESRCDLGIQQLGGVQQGHTLAFI